VPAQPAPPSALEWPSDIRAGEFDETYEELRALNQGGATRWRVARLAAEWALSNGYFEKFEKWDERADLIEERIRSGTY
jgi:hypothetical protein